MSSRWGGDPLADDGWPNAILNLIGLIACAVIVAIILLGASSTT